MPPTYLESPPNELNKLPPIDGNPGKEFVKKEPLFSPICIYFKVSVQVMHGR
jgi:hypothetical protein